MLIHPQFDPVAIHLGPVAIRWYGLMYLAGFIMFLWFGRLRIRQPHVAARGWEARDLDDMLFFGVLGVILGGRLGYVLFYKPGYYAAHPAEIIAIWQGGMSFHGGLLGVMIAMVYAARRHHIDWLRLMDFIAPLIPPGIAAGRLGNFINAELPGRVTDVPWAMLFPGVEGARHPSQLYQFALEGVTLFFFLWWFSSKPRPRGQVSAMFLIGYGVLRFVAEFAREPDSFIGYLALGFTMGQWLCLAMVAGGIALYAWSRR
ncbi:MAG TPA: prolipoprotein diacylglyceryl transferase [Burkholderiales bacterium]